MKKLYDRNPLCFAILWIVAYCLLLSLGDAASAALGIEKAVTLPVALLLSLLLFFFLRKHGLFSVYGLCPPKASARSMLFYLPVLLMLTANFWHGATMNYQILGTVLYILAMFCVGFLEEIIFRGLLFQVLCKENKTLAIVVSSVTFGIGHIVNLLNGSGAELLPNLLQVLYATAAGFMFVMIYVRSGSLLIPILSHGLFNAFSAFAKDTSASPPMQILTAALLTLITGGYAAYLALTAKKNTPETK